MSKILTLFLLLINSFELQAQILPKEGGKLNYRIIGFSFPGKPGVKNYEIEIAEGNYYNIDSFRRNIVMSFSDENNKIIGEVSSFGKMYTWDIVYKGENSKKRSDLHHFSTMVIPGIDKGAVRLRVEKNAEKYSDGYVFVDATRSLWDMKGNPVWFLPNIEGFINDSTIQPMDLKPSPFGTITFISGPNIFEINYNGEVLWANPEKPQYHHEFTRLSNGNYMVLGSETVTYSVPTSKDVRFLFSPTDGLKHDDDTSYKELLFTVLKEYDQNGHKVWSWSVSNYLLNSDLLSYCENDIGSKSKLRENAFYFDEQNGNIYISFRNISRVIKVKYPEGNVLNTFGQIYGTTSDEHKKSLFCNQHSCRRSQKGFLYLYNNNDCNAPDVSSIVMMQEPIGHNDTLRKVWEYKCTSDDVDATMKAAESRRGGGNVIELPDNSLFAATGYYFGEIFIVSIDKKILWSAIPEKWDNGHQKWFMLPSYRANIITNRRALEELIWKVETN